MTFLFLKVLDITLLFLHLLHVSLQFLLPLGLQVDDYQHYGDYCQNENDDVKL